MSCRIKTPNINKTFIIEPYEQTPILSACTEIFTNKISECTGNTITLNSNLTVVDDIIPSNDITSNIGSPNKRFREINLFSGNTTIWSATQVVNTPTLDLGVDSLNNNRIINANNSIIQLDTLKGGTY